MATSNYSKNIIAAAEYGLNPEVHIYKIPSKDTVHKFKADTTIRLHAMCFSRDGKYLLMIGGVPDFRISIFDLESNKKLNLVDTKLPFALKDYRKIKFNPSDNREFAILSNKSIFFYKIQSGYEVTEQHEQKFLGEQDRMTCTEFIVEEGSPDIEFSTFIWDTYKRVHITCDMPCLIMVDSKTAKQEATL
jgi:WD40 repeat protein